jgi:hypothetical protein
VLPVSCQPVAGLRNSVFGSTFISPYWSVGGSFDGWKNRPTSAAPKNWVPSSTCPPKATSWNEIPPSNFPPASCTLPWNAPPENSVTLCTWTLRRFVMP